MPPPPPLPRVKRHNTVLRLYDAPLHRDWAAWTTAFMVVMTAFAIGTSEDPRGMPAWLDTLLATITFTVLFGVVPAWIRLLIRRQRWRARQVGQVAVQEHPTPPPAPQENRPSPRPAPQHTTSPPRVQVTSPPPPRKVEPDRVNRVEGTLDRVNRMEGTQALTHAQQTLPHPVARAIRALQQADTPRDQYEAMLDAAESLALTVCVTAAALLHKQGTGSGLGVLSGLRSSYLATGTTFGTWTVGLSRVAALAAEHEQLPSGFSSGVVSMVDDLKTLKDERNRTAHGDKPLSQPEASLRVAECGGFLEHALTSAQFLEESPWLCIATCDYRQRSRTFHVVARNATGDHPVFELQTYEWDEPVAGNAFYLRTPEECVPLSPFITYSFCPQCRQMETCYTWRVRKLESHATVKSFSRGHEIPVPELGDEIRALPSRG